MGGGLGSLGDVANALKGVASAGLPLGDPSVPAHLASFSLQKGPSLSLGTLPLTFPAGLSVEIDAFNGEDDADADGLLLANVAADPPVLLTAESAWLKYRLSGSLGLQGGAELGSVGFSLDGTGGVDLFDYHRHGRSETVAPTAAADLGAPRFLFAFPDVLALAPGEALALRAGGSLTLGVSVSWSDVLSASLKSVSALLGAAVPLRVVVPAGLTAVLNVTLGGEFFLVFSRGQDATLRLSVRKASSRGVTATATASLDANLGNLDKALGTLLGPLLPGGLDAAPAQLSSGVRDAIRKAAETRIALGFRYEYGRSETNALLLDVALLAPETFRDIHAPLVKGDVTPLLRDITDNAAAYRLKQFLRRDTLTIGGSWGFSLSAGSWVALKGIDTETLTRVMETDGENRRRIAYDGLRGYRASLFGEKTSWTTDFTARMAGFVPDPKASDFEYGLHLSFQPSSNLSSSDAPRLLDLTDLWRRDGPSAAPSDAVAAALGKTPTRFSVEMAVPGAALAAVALRAANPAGPDRLPEALAAALPWRGDSPSRQSVGGRTRVFAPLWRAILGNPDLRAGGASAMRSWVQNALRATDMALALREGLPQISGTLVDVLEKQSYFFDPPNSLLGHVASLRGGLAALARLLGPGGGSIGPDEIPDAYRLLLPFLSQAFFVHAFARYVLLLAADAGVADRISSSARLDFNGGSDALLF